jgi:hypothetical protein
MVLLQRKNHPIWVAQFQNFVAQALLPVVRMNLLAQPPRLWLFFFLGINFEVGKMLAAKTQKPIARS